MERLIIDTAQSFPHLRRAPVVESVIDIRTLATVPFEEEALRNTIEPQLEGYGFLVAPREFRQEFRFEASGPSEQNFQDLGLKGLHFRSNDQRQIVQFNRDGFVFSRLEPYSDWETFVGEGLQLWRLHGGIARPQEVHRIGLRFINRIQLPVGESLIGDYIQSAPVPPRDLPLPFHGFLHQETLAVPGHHYAVNVTRTIQPPSAEGSAGIGLILDIDVFTTQGFDLGEEHVIQSLQEMRWLKDKVFFGSITPKAQELFQ